MTRTAELAFYHIFTPTKIRIGLSLIERVNGELRAIKNIPNSSINETFFPIFDAKTEEFL